MSKLSRKQKNRLKRIWKTARPFCVVLISLLIVVLVVRIAAGFVLSHFIEPVDVNDATPIEVVIPKSSSASTIASILYHARGEDEDGLIPSTAVFKVYVDFVGKAQKMQAGTYTLSRNMTMKQIVDILCEGNPPRETISITIPEGYTAMDIATVLVEKGIISDTAAFTAAMQDDDAFDAFTFLPDRDEQGRENRLEGYLFPDTYEIYQDATAGSVIVKMLNRTNEIWTEEYQARADELGMTMDQVMTLASLIQNEAQVDTDFAKVSAVFHARLERGMKLESCASLCYVLKTRKYTFTAAELETDSPYNTYQNAGLPVGPICNPGRQAIEAALWPDEDYLAEGYLYFSNGKIKVENADGTVTYDYSLVFDKTYEEQQAHVAENRPYWP